jgi:hypothetical protein
MVPANASVMKTMESRPWPTRVEHIGKLCIPERSRRYNPAQPDGNDHDKITKKAEPYNLPGLGISIHLCQDVTAYVTDGKYQNTCRQNQPKNIYQFHGNDIGRYQAGHKYCNHENEPVRISRLSIYRLFFLICLRSHRFHFSAGICRQRKSSTQYQPG